MSTVHIFYLLGSSIFFSINCFFQTGIAAILKSSSSLAFLCMASFLAFSAAFLAIISRFHLGISTPLGSWLGTYKDFFLLNDGAKGNLFPYLKTLTTYKFCPNFLYGLFFGLFCSLLGHHLPLPLGNFNPTGIMAGDLQRFFY